MNYSSPFRRFAAFGIDFLVIMMLYLCIGFCFGILGLASALISLSMIGFWFYGGVIVLTWLYFSLLESSSWQGTVGKKILGLKVTTLSGEKVSFLRASARHFSKLLSRLLFMFGFLMVFWTKKKQALHDKVAATLVIKS